MPTDTIISAKNLSKCYQVYGKPQDRLKQIFLKRYRRYYHLFWALKDVSFDIKKGETLGIIGRNGSGKSTLLQLICGILRPTTGSLSVEGRIAALLELGAGFNPEFSGRENVYMNGVILKLTKKQIDAKFDAIEDFADIGNFIDQPVKTYSSGMFVRLAFAVQACTEPDILIVDEALSVGDIFFQQKCAQRMRQLREQGTTLIFVSHDMGIMRDLCQKIIYLKRGEMIFHGDTMSGIIQYLNEDSKKLNTEKAEFTAVDNESLSFTSFKKTAFWSVDHQASRQRNDRVGEILGIAVLDLANEPASMVRMGETLRFRIFYQSYTNRPLHISLALKNRYDQVINSSGSYHTEEELPVLKNGECAIFEIDMRFVVEAGHYTFSATLGFDANLPNRGVVVDQTPWLGPLTVSWDYENKKAPWLGMFGLPVSSRFIRLV